MNIFFAVNNAYAEQLQVAMVSILENNQSGRIDFYILTADFSESSRAKIAKLKWQYQNFDVFYPKIDAGLFANFNINIEYITKETYYRYLIADVAPELDRALYLDADLVCNGSLEKLYGMDLSGYYAAGAPDLWIEKIGYKKEIGFDDKDMYVNAGVLLMNLDAIRRDKMAAKLFQNNTDLTDKISYQDQDIINITFKGKIKAVPALFNFTIDSKFGERHAAVIIHYTGRIKPWHWDCEYKLKSLWIKYAKINKQIQDRKIHVGLIIDEFFGGAGTAFGGYGFLARKYIAKYLPSDRDIEVDVLIGRNRAGGSRNYRRAKERVDNVWLYWLPHSRFWARQWLKHKKYDIYLSIELTGNYVLECEPDKNKKLILWIQDPRPKSVWDNIIDTMTSIKEPCFYNQRIYDTVNKLAKDGRVKFISQGYSLNPLAMELYNLPPDTPIQYLPNPVDIDFDFQFDLAAKKKQVIFLGRLETQKRAWLFCEVAKRMPEYEFFVMGQFFRYREMNEKMLAPYMNGDIKNLHFMGHMDGAEKANLIKESRILLNTAIWEGIPISWLEALSYGTLVVSNLEREGLVERFGGKVPDLLGDGFDGVDSFVPIIRNLMENDKEYKHKARAAIEYIRETHNIPRFQKDLRDVIYKEVNK